MAMLDNGSRSEPDTLTPAELVQDVVYATRVSRQAAEAAVNAVIQSIGASLAAGMRIELPGLGTTLDVGRLGLRTGRASGAGAAARSVARRVRSIKPGVETRLGDEAFRRTSVGLTWPPP